MSKSNKSHTKARTRNGYTTTTRLETNNANRILA